MWRLLLPWGTILYGKYLSPVARIRHSCRTRFITRHGVVCGATAATLSQCSLSRHPATHLTEQMTPRSSVFVFSNVPSIFHNTQVFAPTISLAACCLPFHCTSPTCDETHGHRACARTLLRHAWAQTEAAEQGNRLRSRGYHDDEVILDLVVVFVSPSIHA